MSLNPIHRDHPLVLASASPRRKRLLEQVKLPLRVLPSGIDENGPRIGAPGEWAGTLAEKKARDVRPQAPDHWILGADTMVVLGGRILGKPGDREEARRMLRDLQGRTHTVITGYCILAPGDRIPARRESVPTQVTMRSLSPEAIENYIDSGEPFGKAGAYAIQGIGAFMVESITGSYTNVVGLPLCAVIKTLLALDALECFPLPPQTPS